ncbi:MAG: hypothetical protein AMXMBFR33_02590 [Candidatus Xenobia bacterium]
MPRILLAIMAALVLVGCAAPATPPPSTIEPIDKATLTAVNVALKQDPILAGCVLTAEAKHDQVVIKGEVPDEASKKKAEQLARGVHGVAKVDNQIVINDTLKGKGGPLP